MTRSFRFAAAFVAAALVAPALRAETLDEVLQKSYAARGGLEKLKALKTVKMSGKQMVQGMEIPFSMTLARPKSIRVEATVQAMTMIQAYDGKTAWAVVPFAGKKDPEKLSGEAVQSLEEQGDFDGALIDAKEKGSTLELLGKEDLDGSEAWKIKVVQKGGGTLTVFVDVATGLEVKQVMKKKIEGNEIEIESLMSSFKPVGGLTMPHAIESRMAGKTISNILIEKIELDPKVDPAIFRFPEPPAPPASSSAPPPAK
jgi:hypothetical protein